jgi:hypothetical protein
MTREEIPAAVEEMASRILADEKIEESEQGRPKRLPIRIAVEG